MPTWWYSWLPVALLRFDIEYIFGVLDVAAIVVTTTAIIIESVADEQLRQFARSKKKTGDIMDSGLWRTAAS